MTHTRHVLILVALVMLACGQPAGWAASVACDPSPVATPGTELGAALRADAFAYEPSGATWHPRLQQLLIVSDNGKLLRMTLDGAGLIVLPASGSWGDLEGVTVADPATDFVYLGVEHPDSIKEVNLATGQVTRTFDLTPWMVSADPNLGLEALTFVPDATDAEGGLFYAGLQLDGTIFVFRLPIRSSATSTTVTPVMTIIPVDGGRRDLAGLEYDATHQVLYAMWDEADTLRAMERDGRLLMEWPSLPGNDQEGIALFGTQPFDLVIAEDHPATEELWRYPMLGCVRNTAPTVQVGADLAITLPTTSVALAATVSDDGLPAPPGAVSVRWSQESGPAGVTFSVPTALATTATFPGSGLYLLRLSAGDGELTASDDLLVSVASAPRTRSTTTVGGSKLIGPIDEVQVIGAGTSQ